MWTRGLVVSGALAGMLAGAVEPDPALPLYEVLSDQPAAIEGVAGVVSSQRIALLGLAELYGDLSQAVLQRDTRGLAERRYRLPLPDGTVAIVALNSPEKGTADRFLASGRVVSREGGYLALVATPETLDARITVGRTHYQIRSIGAQHFLLLLDPGALPPEAPPFLPKPMSGEPDHDHAAVSCEHDTTKTVRVLVLYTEEARAGAAGADEAIYQQSGNSTPPTVDPDQNIENAVQLAFKLANTALENSLARTRFDTGIVAEPIGATYVEPGSGESVLAALYTPGHPLHGFAAERRRDNEANLVATIVEHWHYCGGAPVMIDWNMHPDQAAFSVVTRACLGVDDQSLGHELAHSMGSAHDRQHARVPGLFPYSYGFNQPGGGAGTVMAYTCADCERVSQFSNPEVNFPGGANAYPSGCPIDSADPDCPPAYNVQSIDRAACRVAAWQ